MKSILSKSILLSIIATFGWSFPGVYAQVKCFTAEDVVFAEGTNQADLVVSIDYTPADGVEISCWQFDLYLPDGVEPIYNQDEEEWLGEVSTETNTKRLAKGGLNITKKTDGGYLVLGFDTKGNQAMVSTHGVLCTITLSASKDVVGVGRITNSGLSDMNNESPDKGNLADYTFGINTEGSGITIPLKQLAFSPVTMTTGAETKVTVVPTPADAKFDVDKVSLELAEAMPAGWTPLVMERVDAGGLGWKLSARSIGDYTINILYDGAQMGTGTVSVRQQLHLVDGWQWMALQGGSIAGGLETVFGNELDEARTESAVVVKATDEGTDYWGSLQAMDSQTTYKVKMNLGGGSRDVGVAGSEGYHAMMQQKEGAQPLTRSAHTGWNWVGNPYQYWQSVNNVFSESSAFSEGDIVKFKNQFATFSSGVWNPENFVLEPGQGMIVYKQNSGQIVFNSEYDMAQNLTAPSSARSYGQAPALWTIDGSRFDDNMALVAQVEGVADPSAVTVGAFAGDECRGISVSADDRLFITVHGAPGEVFTFKVYDHVSGKLSDVETACGFAAMKGSYRQPVVLKVGGESTSISDVGSGPAVLNVYDLQGRLMDADASSSAAAAGARGSQLKKGVYIMNRRKVVVR